MTAVPASVPANASCPRCGAAFRCGMVGADSTCWCIKLPHVMPLPAPLPSATGATPASCFCPACLQQITDERHKPSSASD